MLIHAQIEIKQAGKKSKKRREERKETTQRIKIYIKDTVKNIVLKRYFCYSLFGYTASGTIYLVYGLFEFPNFAI